MVKDKVKNSSIIAAISGNIVEWYDFTLYIFLAPVFAKNFFPDQTQLNSMLTTFLIFALGFFVRPIGSIIFGHLGDKIGRAKTLKINIILISLVTMVIGLLPTHAQIGHYASFGLVTCRILQGLCIGGEFAGSMIYLTEIAATNKRALISCMTNNGSNIGVLLATLSASICASLLTEKSLYLYGWRFAFMIGGVLGIIGIYFRRNIKETPIFNELNKKNQDHYIPIIVIIKEHKINIIKVFLLLIMPATGNYVLIDFMSNYLNQYYNYQLASALKIQTGYMLLTFVFITLAAVFSDKYGRKLTLSIAALGYILFSIPCFYLLGKLNNYLWLLPLVIFYSIEQSTTPVTMVEMFPAKVRYTGLALGYNFAMALVGGTAPFIVTWLIAKFNNPLLLAYYLVIGAAISLTIIATKLPRSHGDARCLLH